MCDLEKEIASLRKKIDLLYEKHMNGYRSGDNTRARTTTANARISELNDRIHGLREILKNQQSNEEGEL